MAPLMSVITFSSVSIAFISFCLFVVKSNVLVDMMVGVTLLRKMVTTVPPADIAPAATRAGSDGLGQ